MKRCSLCREEKPLERFWGRGDRPGHYRSQCAACLVKKSQERNAAMKASDPDGYQQLQRRLLDKKLEVKYGVTRAVYDQMLTSQGGTCAICGALPGRRLLSVDHDHATGQVRALLCHSCNFVIGLAKECPDILRAAAEYLEWMTLVAEERAA